MEIYFSLRNKLMILQHSFSISILAQKTEHLGPFLLLQRMEMEVTRSLQTKVFLGDHLEFQNLLPEPCQRLACRGRLWFRQPASRIYFQELTL